MSDAKPTDFELMMYFDDELEPPRRADVERYLAAESGARLKVKALSVAADALRSEAETVRGADAIADAVMMAIALDPAIDAPKTAGSEPPIVANPIVAKKSADVARRAKKAPARGGGGRVYTFVAFAVAAAAALVVGARSLMPSSGASLAQAVASTVATASIETTRTTVAATSSAASTASEPLETEAPQVNGVEIAAVEFGAKMGSIFYVPGGDAANPTTTTTVVWLAEDDNAGDE